MNMLHIFSNWKWTGPAEHALNTAVYCRKKGYGVVFACASPPVPVEDSLMQRARDAGLTVEDGLYLNKHFHPWQNARDIIRLRACIHKNGFQLIHTHLSNDHLLIAAARALGGKCVPVIRTVYDGLELPPTPRNRYVINHATDSLITVSQASKLSISRDFALPQQRIWTICPGVDSNYFNPQIDGRAARERYGIAGDDPVVGIVARVQRHRRFEVLLEALSRVIREIPRLKALLIGRGTHIEEVAIKPVRELGLANNVILTGYHLDGYRELLAALDAKIFLVPGSDGSCRAVREAMAMGKPVIAANRGMLPELVEDGVSGMVVNDTPENLARAIIRMVNDPPLRRNMGEAARQRICREYSLAVQLEKLEAVYRQALDSTADAR
jgi:glycosyltransferase involved in cell wall biosynthesis